MAAASPPTPSEIWPESIVKFALDNQRRSTDTEVCTSVIRIKQTSEAMMDATSEPKVVHATCVVERSFSRPQSVVFAALSEPDKVRRWMAGEGHSELIEFSCEFQEGGKQVLKYKMGPGTPIAGAIITNEGRFQHIVSGERIVTASTMKMGDRIFSVSQVTFELLPAGSGTDLIITHQGAFFEGSDGPARREHGWNVLADNLAAVINAR